MMRQSSKFSKLNFPSFFIALAALIMPLANAAEPAKPATPAAPVSVPATPAAETKPIMPARSDASLNDVVAALNQLNSKMGQLLDSHTDIGNKQLRAVQSNNANLFAR